MAEETLGYTELEWTCWSCGSRNKGTTRVCTSCGAAMPENAKFDLPAEQKLITDEGEIAKAQRGPDITCAYCGTRNPADAKACSQCGADLSEGKTRQSREVLGAFSSEAAPDVNCPNCGEPNSASALKCKACGATLERVVQAQPKTKPPSQRIGLKVLLGVAVLILIAGLGTCAFLITRTSDVAASVQQVAWERSIDVQEERSVTHEAWQDEIPAGAVKGSCSQKVRKTQSSPAPNAVKVCGTPYTVNQGNGTGKVVQDCQYQIQDNWCQYTQNEWTIVSQETARGTDFQPQWPSLKLRSGQREGSRREDYQVTFAAASKQYKYSPPNANEYAKYAIGSHWTLKVNGLGGVSSLAAVQ